ncbi:MAG: pyruvate kinase [Burkholderiales bacterium]|nr:pyruvate kinase [Nitrosomonas sp.]MCP5276127.1 pyruvate kinase [Burkholderiales bacterium]
MDIKCKTTDHKLHQLYDELHQLMQHVQMRGLVRIEQYIDIDKKNQLIKSIVNLAQYLAMREIDLRPLQEKLAEAGLSSLGRAEPHVYANLKNVINILGRALGKAVALDTRMPCPDFKEGFDILDSHANNILGSIQKDRVTRIMVTLPSEAAADYELVYNLIKEGMDIARINCAHEDLSTWRSMVDNIRQAAAALDTQCRILMDLAGHKIRTGMILNDPQALYVKVKKNNNDSYPNTVSFKIISDDDGKSAPVLKPENDFLFPVPKAVYSNLQNGDRLSIEDARGKQRHINILILPENHQIIGLCDKSIHLVTGLQVIWQRLINTVYSDQHTFRFVNLNSIPGKIRLHAGDDLYLHKTQTPGFVIKDPSNGKLTVAAHTTCSVPGVIDALDLGARVWIDDGKISAYVSDKTPDYVLLRISKTGPKGAKLKADMGLNFPDTTLDLPTLTSKDQSDLDIICEHADMVGFSFVETADDMRKLIAELTQRNASNMPIIAKIETARAVRNLPEILFASLPSHPVGVMIARGDLAVELGNVRLAEIQEEILWLCEAAHVPVVWATQVLESIAKLGMRSRPEFTDAAMSVRAECVMLNKGPYILDAVRSLSAVLKCMQDHQHKKISRLRALHW